jgi:PAS domain S-box-containing protein
MLDANPAACAMYGRSRDELAGQDVQGLFQRDYHAAVRELITSSLAGHPFRGRVQGLRKDGAAIEAEISGSVYELRGQQCVLLNTRDLTERTQAEHDKEELEAKLARSKKMEALGLLAGGVAHDLNNILSGIVSYPDMLRAELTPEAGTSMHEMLEIMQEAGTRAAAVVADLMTMARGSSSQHAIVSVNTLVNEFLMFGESRALKARFPAVRFETRLDEALPSIKAGVVGLKQSIVNLVQNSAEAIQGSGVVRIGTRRQCVDEVIAGYSNIPPGDYVVLSIFDSGTGIAPHDLERIFEPFYTRKQMGRHGTGLGLAIVWNAVQENSGYIDVHSGTSGSTFELYFPVSRETEPSKAAKTSRSELVGNGEKILVVDDEPHLRAIACRMLASLGYQPQAVASGEEAVEYVKANPVDLLVLDMIMDPGINGQQTYERIVRQIPGQKAIIASGYADSEDILTAQTLGVGECLRKPYTLEQLGTSVLLELRK